MSSGAVITFKAPVALFTVVDLVVPAMSGGAASEFYGYILVALVFRYLLLESLNSRHALVHLTLDPSSYRKKRPDYTVVPPDTRVLVGRCGFGCDSLEVDEKLEVDSHWTDIESVSCEKIRHWKDRGGIFQSSSGEI